jgi:two-component system chemotaxis response regulator CheY
MSMKVLVVEDAEGMRKIVAAMLRILGFDDVDTAENGAVGLEFLTATKIDLLVTNWNMPVMNGLELVKQLRQMPQYFSLRSRMGCTTVVNEASHRLASSSKH